MENDHLLNQASNFAQNGQLDRARQLIRQAIKNDNRDVEAWWALANVTQNRKEREHALREVLRLEPDHMHALHMRDQIKAGTLDGYANTAKSSYGNESASIDFLPKAVITLIAYFVFYIVGLGLNIYFLYDANNFRKLHGHKPENSGCLWGLLGIFAIVPVVMVFLIFAWVMTVSLVVGF